MLKQDKRGGGTMREWLRKAGDASRRLLQWWRRLTGFTDYEGVATYDIIRSEMGATGEERRPD